jgi:hypothetical protein
VAQPRGPSRRLMISHLRLLTSLGVAVALTGCLGSSVHPRSADVAPSTCTGASPTRLSHIVWVVMENRSTQKVVDNPQAPYLNSLGARCGVGTNNHGVAHPSLPNYIALTSGSTAGVTDDKGPSAHRLSDPSLFSQVNTTGKTWKSYEEAMPAACLAHDSGRYAVRHNPAAYYVNLAPTCPKNDVPYSQLSADLAANTLPAFSFVTPDLCHDMHDCGVAAGDRWLSVELPKLLSSAAYRSGTTAVFVTWDEDDHSGANQIPLYVVAPSVRPGTRTSTWFRHQQLLHATETMLGLPALTGASGGGTLRTAFHLP